MTEKMKITAITEHEDGSATFDFDLDDTTVALAQELGLKLLIYCGANWDRLGLCVQNYIGKD